MWNTRKVASKLTTSSCSNAAVGEKVARTTIEPTSPHSRHGAARASTINGIRDRANSNLISILSYLSKKCLSKII